MDERQLASFIQCDLPPCSSFQVSHLPFSPSSIGGLQCWAQQLGHADALVGGIRRPGRVFDL